MAKFELVKFIDPYDNSETFAQFTDNRTQVAIYTSESAARDNFGEEMFFDSVEEVREGGGPYADALKAALEDGEVVATLDDDGDFEAE